MLARTMRAMMAASGSASVSAGKKRSGEVVAVRDAGKPAQLHREDHDQQQPQPESWHDMPLTETPMIAVSNQEP
jgi:hypothetical protein